MKKVLITIGIFVAFFVMNAFGVQSSKNNAINYEEKVNSSKSAIMIYEKNRNDCIYNLADCVKSYDKHEAEIIKNIAYSRKNNENGKEASVQIKAITEQYPQLKASDNYQRLMTQLVRFENKIALQREAYNNRVRDYNSYIKRFPTRIFLNWTGYENKDYFYLQFDALSDTPQDLFK